MPIAERWKHKFQIKLNSWVFVPTEEAVEYGVIVKNSLESRWSSPNYYFHLRDGGHVKALYSHVNNSYFIHLDIKDFFGSINKSRITRCLKGLFSYENAREIAVASTVRLRDFDADKYILPFGFVQSPLLASICLRKSKLGKVLHYLSKTKDIAVSVYMDDIIISGCDVELLLQTLNNIKSSAERSKFYLNSEKEEGPSKKITAFNIELSHELLEVTEDRIGKFISAYEMAQSNAQREGIIGYVSSVNEGQAKKLMAGVAKY